MGHDISMGFDSFLACLAAGLLGLDRRMMLPVAALCGGCDAAGTLLAAGLPHRIVPLPDSALYMGFAIVLGIAATGSRRAVYALPLLLGLDNLLGPATDGGLMQGCASAVLAMSGFGFAGLLQRGLSCVAAPAAGRRSGMRH